MKRIDRDSVADIGFEMKWTSPEAVHTERYEAVNANFWRDIFPGNLCRELMGKSAGDRVQISVEPGKGLPPYNPSRNFELSRDRFDTKFMPETEIIPRSGRFYPKGILKDVYGVFPQNIEPFRCAAVQNGHLKADFNHPLSGYMLELTARVRNADGKAAERGGSCNDWLDVIASGPGMQARWQKHPTDYFSDRPFEREDASADDHFYRQPRFVHHIDTAAIAAVREVYGSIIKDGMKVLDLMSSWTSHIPENIKPEKLTGLGMNMAELEKNERLTDRIVHDLNTKPELPFASESYDAIICTVSVEYLIHPKAVFSEMARVLKPGGVAVMTFSNRWFPPKVIKIWKELSEFERMGLVLEYFSGTGKFRHMETLSLRGLPRPRDDKYFPKMRYADPVFAVWGTRDELRQTS
ncbi:MAG: methyltransferase domain-containing protein [Desulfococcaceae bacterium]